MMKSFKGNEYLKLYRKVVDWRWYKDVKTCHFFYHCLIMANWMPGTWREYSYKRGQFITSLPSLAYETGLSIQEVRTAIKHLKKTGELTDWHDSKVRIITVVNFDKYQGEQQTTQQPFQQASNRQATGEQQQNKNIKKEKEIKETLAPPLGGPDGYGEPPDGWDDECERQFLEDAPQNPGKTRKDWWEFWKG